MPTRRVLLHGGRVLWPEHKPLEEVQLLERTTPEGIWFATYQGTPTRPGGRTFKAAWWQGKNRYQLGDRSLSNEVYARYISWDTGIKDKKKEADDPDPSAYVVLDLWPDYRVGVRAAGWEYLEFPDLPPEIERVASRWNYDDKLRAVLIEDKVSGTSAIQTLRATAADWLRGLIVPFVPTTDKVTRAGQAAVWCKEDCVLLPYPGEGWLVDLEDQLFDFPRAAHDDMVDAFDQGLLYLENYLEHGWKARREVNEDFN